MIESAVLFWIGGAGRCVRPIWAQQVHQANCSVCVKELFAFAWLLLGAVSGPAEHRRSIWLGAGF